MGKFVFYVSCFVKCHNGNMVLLWLFRTIIKNDHSNKSVTAHNNAYIIVQGGGGIKGWDLILQIVYPSSHLCACAVEYFSHIEHLMRIHAGELCGTLWTHILLSCPSIYTIHSVIHIYTHIKRLLAGYKLNIAEYSLL